ncbi:unnamed protein product, partial [Prorocentrum cordatum]
VCRPRPPELTADRAETTALLAPVARRLTSPPWSADEPVAEQAATAREPEQPQPAGGSGARGGTPDVASTKASGCSQSVCSQPSCCSEAPTAASRSPRQRPAKGAREADAPNGGQRRDPQRHCLPSAARCFAWLPGSCGGPSRLFQPGREAQPRARYSLELLEGVGLLGRGSFGSVALVRCGGTGQLLALKAISKAMLTRRRLERYPRSEKLAMQRCCSPFVVQLVATFSRRVAEEEGEEERRRSLPPPTEVRLRAPRPLLHRLRAARPGALARPAHPLPRPPHGKRGAQLAGLRQAVRPGHGAARLVQHGPRLHGVRHARRTWRRRWPPAAATRARRTGGPSACCCTSCSLGGPPSRPGAPPRSSRRRGLAWTRWASRAPCHGPTWCGGCASRSTHGTSAGAPGWHQERPGAPVVRVQRLRLARGRGTHHGRALRPCGPAGAPGPIAPAGAVLREPVRTGTPEPRPAVHGRVGARVRGHGGAHPFAVGDLSSEAPGRPEAPAV